MAGELLQQRNEPAAVRFVEAGQQIDVVGVGGAFGLRQQLPGPAREVYGVGAAVVGMRMPPDEAAGFELVDEPDHGVAVDAHGVRKLLLTLAVADGEMAEQPEVAGS